MVEQGMKLVCSEMRFGQVLDVLVNGSPNLVINRLGWADDVFVFLSKGRQVAVSGESPLLSFFPEGTSLTMTGGLHMHESGGLSRWSPTLLEQSSRDWRIWICV